MHNLSGRVLLKKMESLCIGTSENKKNFQQNDQNDHLYINKRQPNNLLLKSLLEKIVKKQGF